LRNQSYSQSKILPLLRIFFEKVAQLLAEQSSATMLSQIPEEDITRLQSRLKKVERCGVTEHTSARLEERPKTAS
jgi:hypothetical protein